MGSSQMQNGKRVPIRKRIFMATFLIALLILVAAVLTSIIFMNELKHQGELVFTEELSQSLSREVEEKALKTNAMLDAYKGYMKVIRDYTENMYHNRDELIETGKFVDSSRASTGEGVYALQSAFASEDYDLDSYMDEMYFFSHMEDILAPIAKNNEEQISTIYLGTKSGMLISYDKWSTLSAVPEPDFYIYDFTKSEWYTKGMHEDDVFFTSLYTDAMGRGLTVTLASPFKDQNGEVQGVLAADFDITGIYNEMISMDLGEGSSTFAVNEENEIITLDSDSEVHLQDYVPLTSEEIQQITSGNTGIIRTKDALYAYAPIKDIGWTLCAMVPSGVFMERGESMNHSFYISMIIFVLIAIALLIAGLFFSNRISKSITHPIELLVDDMQVIAEGDLDHVATVYRNDEIGDLTVRMNEMVKRLKGTINDLVSAQETARKMHKIASTDALTSVKSRSAYVDYIQELQDELDSVGNFGFGLGVFDCDNLKGINDQYGHDKGDDYLKAAAHLICSVFKHSPVFRIGGDEFSVGLRGDDYQNRDELARQFMEEQEAICSCAEHPWEEVRVSLGVAVFDPDIDDSVTDTMRRADKIMYGKKALLKNQRHPEAAPEAGADPDGK